MRIAAYARYSSELQSSASIEDQLRNCRAYCARQGWPAPEVYQDAAVSGARSDRPAYQRLIAVAPQFSVILVDDLSRLSRDSIETAQTIRRLTFAGVRVIGVSDGVDTGRKGHKLEVGMRGIMSEMYLADLAEKVHRGLTGKALSGSSAGGLPYGYRVTQVGAREIDPAQARIVLRIFRDYAAGHTSRQIAAALNRDGVPTARGSTWCRSAIHGDARRGIGILSNPIYVGEQVWNRSRWTKHPDTGRRVRQERPREEWIVTQHPELAIVPRELWEAAKARIGGKAHASHKAQAGRPARYLLSGVLRCNACGGPMVAVDATRYGCATHKERGPAACVGTSAPRVMTEQRVLAGVRKVLLSDDAFQCFQREMNGAMRESAPTAEAAKGRLAAAQRVRENILAALRAGIITPSTKSELEAAERAVSAAEDEVRSVQANQPAAILPRAREAWRAMADALGDHSRRSPETRRMLLVLLRNNAKVRNEGGATSVEIAPCTDQRMSVAGEGFGLYLDHPMVIPIPSQRGRRGG